ncbi:DUF4124 domain-containing protein [Lysobacter yangpyeongensis]|uniref:DUF4124 domain-containing protein n=1 Tax=Lysobacter yangpyeongensis TaxID=346182 RepID=A0ABW0SNX0_9GAMM
MPSRTSRTLLAIATLVVALPVLAGTVYQWKDAKGVTHYSDAPPPSHEGVQNRHLKDAPPAPATSSEASASEDPNCVTARTNLVQLKRDQPVGLDANGDGKPDKVMDAEERAQQVQQNERMIKAFCDKS